MSYDESNGIAPTDFEYVKLQKNKREIKKNQNGNNKSNKLTNKQMRAARFNVPDQLIKHIKGGKANTTPPKPIDPQEELKRKNRAARFGLPVTNDSTSTSDDKIVSNQTESTKNEESLNQNTTKQTKSIEKRQGKKRNTGGIIAAETNDIDDEKRKARELRFQSTSHGTTDALLNDLQEKKRRRLEKFATLRSTTNDPALEAQLSQQEAREERYSFAIDVNSEVIKESN